MTIPSSDDTSIAEHGTALGGHVKGKPIAWVAVALICGGFIAGGIGLIEAQPWLFFVGIAVVAVGAILSWATHAMSNVTARVETPARLVKAAENAAGVTSAGGVASEEPAR